MPKIDVTFSEGALSPEAKAELPAKLAAALLRWEKAPDSDFFRAISWTHLHELAPGATHDANGPDAPSHFVLDVTTPQGALSDRRREGLVKEATELVLEAAGLGEEEGIRVWVLMHEVVEGSWGAAGGVIRFEQLREAARAERDRAAAPVS